MKKILLLILLLYFRIAFTQTCYDEQLSITVDNSSCIERISTDSLPGNIWQFGTSQKPMQDPTICLSRTIVTDTINPYPVNNSSTFTLVSIATLGDYYGFRTFHAYYYCQTDSINDFGKIEVSLDKGQTWIDIVNDTTFSSHINWMSPRPILTGRSVICQAFDVLLTDMKSIYPFQIGDTLLYRFSFYSDSTFDNLTGLMFDNIYLGEFIEGISETFFTAISSNIYPNPSSDLFTIDFENPKHKPFELAVYTINSKPMFTKENITSGSVEINMKKFSPGVYVYKITNVEMKQRAWGRFTVSE